MCMAIPLAWLPIRSTSPACTPARTSRPRSRAASRMRSPHSTAEAGRKKPATTSSPLVNSFSPRSVVQRRVDTAFVVSEHGVPGRIAQRHRVRGRADDVDVEHGHEHTTALRFGRRSRWWRCRVGVEMTCVVLVSAAPMLPRVVAAGEQRPADEQRAGRDQHPDRPEVAGTRRGPDADADAVDEGEPGQGGAEPPHAPPAASVRGPPPYGYGGG